MVTDMAEISDGIFGASTNNSIKYPVKPNKISKPTNHSYSDEILLWFYMELICLYQSPTSSNCST